MLMTITLTPLVQTPLGHLAPRFLDIPSGELRRGRVGILPSRDSLHRLDSGHSHHTAVELAASGETSMLMVQRSRVAEAEEVSGGVNRVGIEGAERNRTSCRGVGVRKASRRERPGLHAVLQVRLDRSS
jgi:hypothetical protein